ncbi:MAG: ABC transporter substrate-binding protein [Rhodospirillales bacterium]|nr:ABC transporter substrate-binding protein [Rhodospirillales bacterium]MDE2199495.1 ABC transporter substrate-binding protein [Rhodospirillales bacterium]MDE2575791.1 ABC transporter substrate-binding protein [Rhodospirillales bacterium]
MSITRRNSLGAALAAGFAVAMAGPAAAQGPVRIGAVLSVTGPASFLGDPELKTLQLYIDQVNAQGGLLGRKLVLVHYDDGGEAGKANGFTKRLLDNDHVDVIIGGSTTGSTMAMIPLVDRAQVPFISLAGGVEIVEPVKKWVFKTPYTDRMAAERVFADMKQRGLTKVALLSETSGFGISGRKQSKLVAAKYGITLVADETYGPKDTDVTAQLTKIKSNPAVQALFVFGFGQGPALVTKNYAQLGMKMPLYQSHGVASEGFIKLAGAAAEGVRLPSAPLLIADKLPAGDPQKKVVEDYVTAYTTKYHEPVSGFGGDTYTAFEIWVDAVKRAGSFDKAKVRDAIEQTKGFVGISGIVNMSPTDHMGLDVSAARLLEIHNGTWTLVK